MRWKPQLCLLELTPLLTATCWVSCRSRAGLMTGCQSDASGLEGKGKDKKKDNGVSGVNNERDSE